jgi:succinoglycan biosynthesis transport protein ExoP
MNSYRPRSIAEYLRLLSSRKYLFVLAGGAMLAACLLVVHRIPDTYESSASIVVTGKDEDRQMVGSRVAAATQRLSSREFLEPIILEHHLYGIKDGDSSMIDGAVGRMRKDILVEPKYREDYPEAVSVSYKNPNPQTAQQVASELVSVFVGMNDAIQQQIEREEESSKEEMTEIEARMRQVGMDKAGQEYRKAVQSRAQSEMNMARAQKLAASSSIEDLSNKQYALQRQIEEQKRQIAAQEKVAKSTPAPSRDGSSAGALLVRKAEIEGQIKQFSTQYTAENPKMVQAKAQLSAVEDEISKLESQSGGAPDASSPASNELRSMQRELARMQIDLDVTNRELEHRQQSLGGSSPSAPAASMVGNAGPIAIGTDSSGRPDDEGLKTRYTSLLTRQDALEREKVAAAGLGPGVFQIVDPPAVPRSPSGPNRVRLVLLAVGLALVFGLVLVAAVEMPQLTKISSTSDVEYYLGTPVIALIPEHLTPMETRRERKLQALRVVCSILLAGALIPVLVMIFNASQLFQMVANH